MTPEDISALAGWYHGRMDTADVPTVAAPPKITVTLPGDVASALHRAAYVTGRSKQVIVTDALRLLLMKPT